MPVGEPFAAASASIGSQSSGVTKRARTGSYQRALRSISPVPSSWRSPMKPRDSGAQEPEDCGTRSPPIRSGAGSGLEALAESGRTGVVGLEPDGFQMVAMNEFVPLTRERPVFSTAAATVFRWRGRRRSASAENLAGAR